MKQRFPLALVTLFVTGLFVLSRVGNLGAGVLEDLGASLVAHFDEAVNVDAPSGLRFERFGVPQIIPGGVSGKAVSLGAGQYLVLDSTNIINGEEGTLTMWVRPHWLSTDSSSHTFASFKWPGPREAYFCLSRGWWEPAGAGLTYFVANNQEAANTSKTLYYNPGKWIHLACVWKTGASGFSRLYVDGHLAAERNPSAEGKPAWLPYIAGKQFYLGTDKGTPIANNRWAQSDIDEVAIFKRALSGDEILKMYTALVNPKYVPLKDAKGNVLETRAIFDEGMSWASDATNLLARIKKAGFNVLIPCVWHGKGTRYPSELAVAESGLPFTFDPLKQIIDMAHAQGIEVHPWFTVALRQRNFYTDFYDWGTPAQAFDVHRPAFRKFIVDIIIDVVKRYDVDGINLDFIRTMGMCKSSFCQDDYKKESGRNLLTDLAQRNAGGDHETHVQQWQDLAITAIVSEVRKRAKEIRPGVIISVDGAPINPYSRKEGRDEIAWANAGLIDVIFDMDYSVHPDYQRHNYAMRQINEPQKLLFLTSNYDKAGTRIVSRDSLIITKIITTLRQRWPWGAGIYLYSMLSDDQVVMLATSLFRTAAIPTWRR